MSLLEIRDLRVSFETARGSLEAVSGVDIDVEQGETVGIVGESGCGKTVTSLSVIGLHRGKAVCSGSISFDGAELLTMSPEEMRRLRGGAISMIFQEPMTALNPVLSIGRQLIEPLLLAGASREAARKAAIAMLEKVNVSNAAGRMSSYPHELSGGLCQRVMIAMALLRKPQLLIADEPTTALDVTIQAQILRLLRELRDETRTAIMLITHDLGVVAEMCDRVYVMYAGRVMEAAGVCEIFDEPLHPYTYGLMRSLPDIGAAYGEELYSIPGTVPALGEAPPGCPFSPRCSDAREICRTSEPKLSGAKHSVRCWKYA